MSRGLLRASRAGNGAAEVAQSRLAAPFPSSPRLGELHREKVEGNYASALLGGLTGRSACWLDSLHRNHHTLAQSTAFVQRGVLLCIYFCQGAGLGCNSWLTGLNLASLKVMMPGRNPVACFIFLLETSQAFLN